MNRRERKRDIERVSPHMETIRGWRLDSDMNGMPRRYWLAIEWGVLIALVYIAVRFAGLP